MFRKEDYICLVLNINCGAFDTAKDGLINFIQNLSATNKERQLILKHWNNENYTDLKNTLHKIYKRNFK